MPPTEKPTDQSKRDGSMWFVEQGSTLEASSVISGIFLRAFFCLRTRHEHDPLVYPWAGTVITRGGRLPVMPVISGTTLQRRYS